MLKLFIFFLLISLTSCGQNEGAKKRNPNVARLANNIIPLVKHLENPDSCRKALNFLDSATAIDNSCFNCYYQKLMFLFSLRQSDKIFKTIDTCINMRPHAHDLYLTAGILHEKFGDTTLSKTYFKKSLSICNLVLDTMKSNNRDFAMLTTNTAINLIMLADSIKANKLLENLYKIQPDDPEFDNIDKKYTLSLMNKSKVQLLDILYNPSSNSR